MKVFYVKSTERNLGNNGNREIIWEGTLDYLKEKGYLVTLLNGVFFRMIKSKQLSL